MKTIDEDIKNGSFKHCYLLCGEEAYLKKQYRDKLVHAMTVRGDTMNFSSYEGKDINSSELIDMAKTLPFFAERRVILVQDSGFFKKSCDPLCDYLNEINESTCLIFVETEIDKRTKTYKAVKKNGAVIEFGVQKEAVLIRWILSRISKEGKKITKETMQLFLERTGTDMSHIDRELEKLLCYTLEREVIEALDVETIVTGRLENKIFEMTDAISSHNRKKALELYYDLLSLKEPPMRILYLIIRQLRILAEVKELVSKGCAGSDLAAKVGVPEFAVRKYIKQAKGFSNEMLLNALKAGAGAEEAVKTGRLNDKIAVELCIVSCSSKTDFKM
ncbi:MAG: DNA polymerase III subunit delta [Eubacterium sp.]|nr:DNA polymerase III subunit delta [Eubacterium sp.]